MQQKQTCGQPGIVFIQSKLFESFLHISERSFLEYFFEKPRFQFLFETATEESCQLEDLFPAIGFHVFEADEMNVVLAPLSEPGDHVIEVVVEICRTSHEELEELCEGSITEVIARVHLQQL